MNLIELLGGYEKAKSIYENRPQQADNYTLDGFYYEQWFAKKWIKFDGSQLIDCDKPNNPIHLSTMHSALLEYRRKHDIFEDGDIIVYPWVGNELHKYSSKVRIKFPMRHATDAEIKTNQD